MSVCKHAFLGVFIDTYVCIDSHMCEHNENVRMCTRTRVCLCLCVHVLLPEPYTQACLCASSYSVCAPPCINII